MPSAALPFSPNHPVFKGHFPGQPIVPGVLLLDWAQQAIQAQEGLCFEGLTEAKFHSPATPADSLRLDYEISATSVRFVVHATDRKIASGRFPLPRGTAVSRP